MASKQMEEFHTMNALLIRHAMAGKRSAWVGDDRLRPLDQRGRQQADELVEKLKLYAVKRIFSSGYLRCTQTIEPLAGRLGLSIEIAPELEEGTESTEIERFLEMHKGDLAVYCTHGDVIEAVLEPGIPNKKAGIWILLQVNGRPRPLRYIAP